MAELRNPNAVRLVIALVVVGAFGLAGTVAGATMALLWPCPQRPGVTVGAALGGATGAALAGVGTALWILERRPGAD